MKKKAFVVGSNTKESLSPHIFNYWFKQKEINAEYFFREIKIENFDKEINTILKDKDVCGFNVTMPFKEKIIENLNEINKHASEIGAVNCVSKINNSWVGKNTDWTGFSKSINRGKNPLNKKTATVIGYGGASKAIIYALKKDGFNEIKIFNRSSEKTEHLKKEKNIKIINKENLLKELKETDIVINTTPTNVLEGLEVNKKELNIFACDIVYRPKETNFLSMFKEEKRIYGIYMLVYQAAPCFEEWFGVKPEADQGLFDLLEGLI